MRFLLLIFLFSYELRAQVAIPQSYWHCRSGAAVNSSSDTTNANFSAGILSNTVVTGNTVSLAVAAPSGTFTSRTFDVLQSCIQFNNYVDFSWNTSIPFYKELPTSSELVADYPSVLTTLRTNLIGHWRMNEPTAGTAPGSTDFRDYSGSGNHATRTGTITMGAAGRFVNGISSNNTAGYVDFNGVAGLIGSTSSYTFSIWYNLSTFTNGCGGSGTYLLDRALTGGGNPLAGICTRANVYAYETRCNDGSNLQQVNGAAVVLNTWQHVVIQRDRTAGLYRIFGNGVQVNTVSDGGGCAVTLDAPRLARHATGTNQGMTGMADDFMIWNRALTAAEILQIYRRGGNRLQFQFRACGDMTCSANPAWIGPDGTSSTYFSELQNNSIPTTSLGNVLATAPTMTFVQFPSFILGRQRYFQYRAYLNSESTANTPDFNWTRVNW